MRRSSLFLLLVVVASVGCTRRLSPTPNLAIEGQRLPLRAAVVIDDQLREQEDELGKYGTLGFANNWVVTTGEGFSAAMKQMAEAVFSSVEVVDSPSRTAADVVLIPRPVKVNRMDERDGFWFQFEMRVVAKDKSGAEGLDRRYTEERQGSSGAAFGGGAFAAGSVITEPVEQAMTAALVHLADDLRRELSGGAPVARAPAAPSPAVPAPAVVAPATPVPVTTASTTLDIITKRDGTVLRGSVQKETPKGFLFKVENGPTTFVDFADIADLKKETVQPVVVAPPPAQPAPAVDAPPTERYVSRAEREAQEEREEEERAAKSGPAILEAHEGFHVGAELLAGGTFSTGGAPSGPQFIARILASIGLGPLDLRAGFGPQLQSQFSLVGGFALNVDAMLHVSRLITLGAGLQTGVLLALGQFDGAYIAPTLHPLAFRFGSKRQLELGLFLQYQWMSNYYFSGYYGRATYDQCYEQRVPMQYGGSACRAFGARNGPNAGVRFTWLFL